MFQYVRFPNVKVNEGDWTNWKLYLLASRISFVNKPLYVQRIGRRESVSKQFNVIDQNSISAIEGRIAILVILEFDMQDEYKEYRRRLMIHRDHDLDVGRYDEYLDATTKLDILDKYSD